MILSPRALPGQGQFSDRSYLARVHEAIEPQLEMSRPSRARSIVRSTQRPLVRAEKVQG